MSNTPDISKVHYYVELVLRRRWLLVIPFSLSMIAGMVAVFVLPRIYSAQTLILVEPQRVPSNYVQSIVTSDIDSRISTISQQIMSRTNLEKIINEFKLFSGPKYADMYLEDKLALVRRRISVDVTRARQGADAFTISFKGTDPRIVMNVANTLATYFIDENLKAREAQAIGTSDFIDNERVTMLKRLEEVENTLKDYRTKYMGELPEQLESNLSILSRLQEQLGQRQQRLSETQSRLIDLEALSTEPLRSSPGAGNQPGRVVQPGSEETANLDQLKARLTELQSKYTDRHPDVIKLKKLIAELEAKNVEKPEQTGLQADRSIPPAPPSATPAQTAQRRQIDALKREIGALETEVAGIKQQIKIYQDRVEVTPKREQELMSLRRDYDNILSAYNSLQNRKLEAEIAVNMEKKQKGEQFRIIDAAVLPEKPVSPDMRKLFILYLGAGLGVGCGLIILLDYTDTSFKETEDVETFIGVPVLVTIPLIEEPETRLRQVIRYVLNSFSIMIPLGLFAGFALLTLIGIDRAREVLRSLMAMAG